MAIEDFTIAGEKKNLANLREMWCIHTLVKKKGRIKSSFLFSHVCIPLLQHQRIYIIVIAKTMKWALIQTN